MHVLLESQTGRKTIGSPTTLELKDLLKYGVLSHYLGSHVFLLLALIGENVLNW